MSICSSFLTGLRELPFSLFPSFPLPVRAPTLWIHHGLNAVRIKGLASRFLKYRHAGHISASPHRFLSRIGHCSANIPASLLTSPAVQWDLFGGTNFSRNCQNSTQRAAASTSSGQMMGSAKQTEHSRTSWDEKELEPPAGLTAAL